MVKPIDSRPTSPDFAPISPEDLSYSKLAVMGIFLAAIPLIISWGALVLLSLPLKGWNLIQQCRGGTQLHFINAFIQEYLDLLSLIVRYPCSKNYHYTSGEGKPILLVHGYLHNASAWYYMIDRMKKENLGPIYAIDLGDGTTGGKFWSIKQYAQQVLEKTQEIALQTGRKDLSIVAHSMGGLVSAAYAKLAPHDAEITIITLGSPLDGTPIAERLATGPNGRSMIPQSEFIKDIRAGIESAEDHIQFLHIAAKRDLLVPEESALMGKDPEKNVSFDDIGHSGLLTTKVVADKVCQWLKV